eukprot:s3284_g11.t1
MAASSSSRSLANLGGSSFISNAALSKVLKGIKENPAILTEAGDSRWAIKRKREKDDSHVCKKPGNDVSYWLAIDSGETMEAWFVHPVCLLDHLIQTSPWFARLMAATICQHEEVHLVLYADEVTPGNALRPLNRRKTFTGQRMLWSVKSKDLQVELNETNLRYIFAALECSDPIEKKEKAPPTDGDQAVPETNLRYIFAALECSDPIEKKEKAPPTDGDQAVPASPRKKRRLKRRKSHEGNGEDDDRHAAQPEQEDTM